MASSIEPEFNPPDNLSRAEVIEMARRYINYWKIEAESWQYKWQQELENKRIQQLEEANQILRNGLEQMRKANEALWEDLKRITK